jgi:hypothetical protein
LGRLDKKPAQISDQNFLMYRLGANGMRAGGCAGIGGNCELAGAGYDISASRSDSTSQAANQAAHTYFNFGSGSLSGGFTGQSNTPNSTAVAARNAGATTTPTTGEGVPMPQGGAFSNVNWPMVGAAAAGLVAVGLLVYLASKFKG